VNAPRLSRRAAMAGVSLIELMISIMIGMLVIAALASIFANTSAARSELDRTSRQIENGRFAMDLIGEDMRVAGFYGEYNASGVAVPAALASACSTTPADWAAMIPVGLQGFDNGSGAPGCLPGTVVPNTDILVVRRVSTCEAGVAGCAAAVAGQPYIQVSKCSTESAATPYVIGLQGTATFNLHTKDCATLAGLRQYIVHIYYINSDNGQGVNIPTLFRLEFDGANFNPTPLVEGIEQLNIEYGIDYDGDGQADAYTANPSTFAGCGTYACTAMANWSNVVSARINLLARNTDASPNYTDTKTYYLGNDATGAPVSVTPGGAYHRHEYASAVRAINISARREHP
jgi:type IV pilus assembly protein PilW